MFGISFYELAVVALVAIIFISPDKLPDFMKKAGRFFVKMRRMTNEVRSTFNTAINEVENEIRKEKAEALKQLLAEHRQNVEKKSEETQGVENKNAENHHDSEGHSDHHDDHQAQATDSGVELGEAEGEKSEDKNSFDNPLPKNNANKQSEA